MHSFSSHKTALLIFARSSKDEVAHKSIHNGSQLFDALTNHVLITASKTQLPYFHFSEEKQIGNTFGERFTNAIQKVFEQGFKQIITIGNDTPQLKASHILEAEKQLLSNKSVIGQSTDGGFYLMGLHKSKFDKDAFEQLAWQTSKVSRQLLKLVSQGSAKVFQLPTLLDVDTPADLESIAPYAHQFSEELFKAILNTIRSKEEENFISLKKFYSPALGIQHNKGSPIRASR